MLGTATRREYVPVGSAPASMPVMVAVPNTEVVLQVCAVAQLVKANSARLDVSCSFEIQYQYLATFEDHHDC